MLEIGLQVIEYFCVFGLGFVFAMIFVELTRGKKRQKKAPYKVERPGIDVIV